jgi:WD40 repeat protein
MLSLPSSPIESLNLTISGNVHCVKFSPCGLKLAAGLDTEDLHAVLLFDIPSGNLLRSLKNHHGLIYDLSWKEVDNSSSYIQYLASASADSTACIWSMKNGNEATLKCVKVSGNDNYFLT